MARFIAKQAEKPAAKDCATLAAEWRWSQSGWSAEPARSSPTLDAAKDEDNKD